MKTLFLTDKGKVRHHNEDSGGIYENQTGQSIAVVADGMGGHQAGDVASNMATSFLQKKWENIEHVQTPDEIETWLRQIVQEMNRSIYDQATRHKDYSGMGTTIVIAVCTYEFVTLAHIGDSRCYLMNANGFTQMTEDHSLVNELVRSGQLSKEQAHDHPRKNVVLKALGTEYDVNADVKTINWDKGDMLLLCSDGLTDKVSEPELQSFLNDAVDITTTGKQLIQLANDRGGEDNISLAIVLNGNVGEGEAS
ncbi:Stp1/IreP family PP2C-type Ser/Thr phosphatase [Lentibacillus saliphilus]|uniref:Stp1/IreP family PP2C-type Ser/Thr phosphatase n=1 Tax=Lentibacillus saliphilus TaxID=2737028 RepID=UPI001C2F8773|nr:Stp1/IreP family PP2C-type Ser/Thr phosphatase [Lentibacillus saliphilus]